jgi:hypothetical protein
MDVDMLRKELITPNDRNVAKELKLEFVDAIQYKYPDIKGWNEVSATDAVIDDFDEDRMVIKNTCGN